MNDEALPATQPPAPSAYCRVLTSRRAGAFGRDSFRQAADRGLEGAQILLGHSKAEVAQSYAERDMSRTATVAAKIGWLKTVRHAACRQVLPLA